MTPTSDDPLLSGRTALVTGAGRGLGRDFALGLAAAGAKVVVNDIDESAEAVRQEIEARGGIAVASQASVADPGGAAAIVEAALSEFGQLDAVINNAGVTGQTDFEEMSLADFDSILAVSLRGAVAVSQAAYRHMLSRRYGRIVMVSSSSGSFGLRGQVAYAAAKAGQLGVVRALAIEGAQHGIGVNAVLPYAATNPGRTKADIEPEDWQLLEPRRSPAHVTPLVVYLASEACGRSGKAYSALSGRYAEVFSGLTVGWLNPSEAPPSPGELAERIGLVEDRRDYAVPDRLEDEMSLVAAQLREQARRSDELKG